MLLKFGLSHIGCFPFIQGLTSKALDSTGYWVYVPYFLKAQVFIASLKCIWESIDQKKCVSVFHRPLHLWVEGRLVDFRKARHLHFRKWGGAPSHVSGKNVGCANFFEDVCMPLHACLGAILGAFPLPISKNPQNVLPSRLRRSRFTHIPIWQGRAQKQSTREPVRLALCSFGPSTAVLAAFRALICTCEGSTTLTLPSRAARPCKTMHKVMHLAGSVNVMCPNSDLELYSE